jgi:hypothetical protein
MPPFGLLDARPGKGAAQSLAGSLRGRVARSAFLVDPVSIIAQHLEEFATLERLCCPFMTVAVRAGTVGAQPVLEMGGGDAVKKLIAAEFGISRRPTL